VTSGQKLARALVAAFVAVLLSACTQPAEVATDPSPRALTEAEAERLAVVRFRNFEDRGVKFSAIIPHTTGQLSVIGYVNYRKEVGYALVRPMAATDQGLWLVQWNAGQRVLWGGKYDGATPPLELPDFEPESQSFAPSGSSLDAFLAIMLALGGDRPDNPQLLLQSDAQWLRSDAIGEVAVDVIKGPTEQSQGDSRTTYWLDERGQMLRLELQLSGPALIDFTPEAYQKFEIHPLLKPKAP
jgi:hypothetical protein